MADMNVTGQGAPKVDLTKWKKLTPQEIISEEGKGEEIPAEILAWAQQMAAFANVPDSVTYDKVDGDVGVEALDKLGILPEEAMAPEVENAEQPVETEEPDAVKDPTKPAEIQEERDNIFATENPENTPPAQEPPTAEEVEAQEALTLADDNITTDNEEILKRKRRRGQPEA